jgi:RNA polymerase sigma factor (sigma-70 family)
MSEAPINRILQQLRLREPEEAWTEFLQEYSTLIFSVVRHLERDIDRASDCFQFVCEQLSNDSFRRLRRFKPEGPAKFSTWLRAVVRNLCLDWRRKEFGRRRVFRSIARLSSFDQEVFRCVYERGDSIDATFVLLQSRFSDVTPERFAESRERIDQELTVKQRWLLGARIAQGAAGAAPTFEEPEAALREISDPRPDPETQAVLSERRAALDRALEQLSKRERLLVRLRFEQEVTLEQIANLLDLGNAQRADRQIKEILARLRVDLS